MFERIIWITGMPRSGTNWFSQILASHPDVRLKFCPLFSYEFKNRLDENSSREDWLRLLKQVYSTESDYMDQDYLRREGHVPAFHERKAAPSVLGIKSTRYHNLTPGLITKCPEIYWIGIVRNPCAAIHSWLSNPLEFPENADPAKEWRTGQCRKNGPGEYWGFDDWKYVAGMFIELENTCPDRFYLARYEEFVKTPEIMTGELFERIGLDMHKQTTDFLRNSQSRHSEHARSVFKKPENIEYWKDRINPKIRNEIEKELEGTLLARFCVSPGNKKHGRRTGQAR